MKLYDANTKVKFKEEKMFNFEGTRNLQRYDEFKYQFFYERGNRMDSLFWKPAEVSLVKDKVDFKTLEEHEEMIFTLNIKRQEILDSLQGRAPILTFGRVTTIPELEYCLTRLVMQETNHSDTYAHILKNIYDDSTKVFDEILDDEVITKHSINIAAYYEDFYKKIALWEALDEGDERRPTLYDMKKSCYLALVAWNVLEGIRFYVSFACSFAFAENKKMEGNAKEIKLIARDENVHLSITQKMINILKKEKSEEFQEVIADCEEEVYKIYEDAALDEIEWAEKLFSKGTIIGLNTDILISYMKYLTNERSRAIGYKKIFNDAPSSNPIPWINAWLGFGKTEFRPQETQITDYQIANTNDTMEEEDWM